MLLFQNKSVVTFAQPLTHINPGGCQIVFFNRLETLFFSRLLSPKNKLRTLRSYRRLEEWVVELAWFFYSHSS
jgi:hypothetical protein